MKENKNYGKFRDNNDQALEELFKQHYKSLCTYILQFTNDLATAEDIVQSVFAKLWIKKEQLKIDTSLKAYLYRTAFNTYIDHSRKKKRESQLLESLKNETIESRQENLDSRWEDRLASLKAEVENLPPKCREILLLSKRDGYKNREIAELLGISIKTVESQIRIAFQKIRKGLQNEDLFLFVLYLKDN